MISDVTLVEWFDEHWYRFPHLDKAIASVTTKLSVEDKPGLHQWRGDIGNREADLRVYEAGERGKRIHFAWWTYIMGGIVLYNPWQKPLYDEKTIEEMRKNKPVFILKTQDEMLQMWKLQRFFEIVRPKILHAEMIVFDVPTDIAGTLDDAFLIEKGTYDVNGSKKLVIPETGIYIADLKTGKYIGESVWMQMAPYCFCYEKMGFGKPKGAIVLHTSATTRSGIEGFATPFRSAEELVNDLADYHHLAAIWKRNNPHAKPDIFKFPSKIERKGENT